MLNVFLQDLVVDFVEKVHPSYPNMDVPFGNFEPSACSYRFNNYHQHDFVRKLKRRKTICACKHEVIPKLKDIIGKLFCIYIIKFYDE